MTPERRSLSTFRLARHRHVSRWPEKAAGAATPLEHRMETKSYEIVAWKRGYELLKFQ
jgi:hypothetical protein